MYRVLIRDEDDEALYRTIHPDEAHRMVVCRDGDLYRTINDPAPRGELCMAWKGERLCEYPQPHEHR